MSVQQLNFLNELPITILPEGKGQDSQALFVAGDDTERRSIEARFAPLIHEELALGKLVSYVGSKSAPLLRLFRYKEAFAYNFVEEFIGRLRLTNNDYVFDPFGGMGTTLYASMLRGISSIGIDKLPIGPFVTHTLPLFYALAPGTLFTMMEQLQTLVPKAEPAPVAMDVAIMKVAFPEKQMLKLRQWKSVISILEQPLRDIFTLLWLSIIEGCSYTTKDGQFLRLRKDKSLVDPTVAMWRKVQQAEDDIRAIRLLPLEYGLCQPQVYIADARDLHGVPFEQAPTALITSPPYVNRYDYTRSYSLELAFQFVDNFAGLKDLRFSILRSHIESKARKTDVARHPVVQEVVNVLRSHGEKLNNERIPDMIIAYFVDMEQVISEWARVLAPGAKVVMVVGNVRFDGEQLPVDLILSEIAQSYGFRIAQVIVTRYKGNSSQQMGKYGRVAVRESAVVWTKER